MTSDSGKRLHAIAVELAAMAQNGLMYSTDHYDIDRYERTREISAEILALLGGGDPVEYTEAMRAERGHATPKVDVRGALFDDQGRVLLVRETREQRWSLPGGWADALDAPSEAVAREVREEAGLNVQVTKLALVHDGSKHNGHAGTPWHIYKHFFLLHAVDDAQPTAGLDGETSDVGYFSLDGLPELSTGRNTEEQLRALLRHHGEPSLPTEFD